jgi:hypothetical protein
MGMRGRNGVAVARSASPLVIDSYRAIMVSLDCAMVYLPDITLHHLGGKLAPARATTLCIRRVHVQVVP